MTESRLNDPTYVRARIEELEEGLALWGYDQRERFELERQIEQLESWLEDLTTPCIS